MSHMPWVSRGLFAVAIACVVSAGCSDPSPPIAAGAARVQYGRAQQGGTTCPAEISSVVTIGQVDSQSHQAVADNTNEVYVQCSIRSDGNTAKLRGKLTFASTIVVFSDIELSSTGRTEGYGLGVISSATALKRYAPVPDYPCTFDVIDMNQTGVWFGATCPVVGTDSAQHGQCSFINAYFYVENCDVF